MTWPAGQESSPARRHLHPGLTWSCQAAYCHFCPSTAHSSLPRLSQILAVECPLQSPLTCPLPPSRRRRCGPCCCVTVISLPRPQSEVAGGPRSEPAYDRQRRQHSTGISLICLFPAHLLSALRPPPHIRPQPLTTATGSFIPFSCHCPVKPQRSSLSVPCGMCCGLTRTASWLANIGPKRAKTGSSWARRSNGGIGAMPHQNLIPSPPEALSPRWIRPFHSCGRGNCVTSALRAPVPAALGAVPG